MSTKSSELLAELKQLVTGRPGIWDTLLPPVLLLILYAGLGLGTAVTLTGAGLILLFIFRLVRQEPLRPVLGGLLSLLVAAGVVALLDDETGFFLPSMISSGGTVVVALASLLWKRPMVAWTSFLARRWPWEWYWHDRVRPAYSEVTWLWAGYFLARLLIQLFFYNRAQVGALTTLNLIFGWPATLILLMITYLYGTWRLRQLAGPSVEEFKAGALPPWEGQRRGF